MGWERVKVGLRVLCVERVAGPDLIKILPGSIRHVSGRTYILQRCRPLDLT
jgi:hypothetical protein